MLTADISLWLSKTKYLFDIIDWGVAGMPASFDTDIGNTLNSQT